MGGLRRVAVINQMDEGGATAVARDILRWGPSKGLEVRYWPEGDANRGRLHSELDAFAPDVVHAHCWYRDYGPDLLAELSERFAVVFTVHDVAVVNQYGIECWECYRNPYCFGCPALQPLRRWRPNYRVLSRLRKRRLNKRVRCRLIYPSAWMKRRLERTEWRRLPGLVIPYGVDTQAFHPGEGSRPRWDLPGSQTILFAGNMYSPSDHRKGLPELLGAFQSLRSHIPDAVLAVAGRVEGVEAGPGVRLLGDVARADLPALYRSADLFCIPSRGDNLPVAVLEAMASGLPVVGTRVGGIPEEIADGATGTLVPPGDVPSLAAALRALLESPETLRAFGEKSRERAVRRFSLETSAELQHALYQDVAESR